MPNFCAKRHFEVRMNKTKEKKEYKLKLKQVFIENISDHFLLGQMLAEYPRKTFFM